MPQSLQSSRIHPQPSFSEPNQLAAMECEVSNDVCTLWGLGIFLVYMQVSAWEEGGSPLAEVEPLSIETKPFETVDIYQKLQKKRANWILKLREFSC